WLEHTTTYEYDANSNLTTQSYPNGVVATFTHDNANRLTAIVDRVGSSAPILSLSYNRDGAGQLTSENGQTYGYNNLQQLTSAGSTGYTYDQADRLTQIVVIGGNTNNLVYDVG